MIKLLNTDMFSSQTSPYQHALCLLLVTGVTACISTTYIATYELLSYVTEKDEHDTIKNI